MRTRFHRDGVELDLTKSEYIFVYLSLSYVLHGARLEDHDFANILGMSKEDAEILMTRMSEAEDEARARGEHWSPPMKSTDRED